MVDFYNNKRVLVTGHTGFKGSWLAIWLHSMGARVAGYALDPATGRDNFVLSGIGGLIERDVRGDIRDGAALGRLFDEFQPEIVFHLAAQPLVRLSYDIPVETWDVNVMGTIAVMEQVRQCSATRAAVMITTDKCYENREQLWGYRENEAMGGHDPYASSKGAAELAISAWRRSFFSDFKKGLASARAGNVVGGGDWAADRIIPDCVRALEKGEVIEIRSPRSIRPWQHVLEPLNGYMLLAKKLWSDPEKYSEGWNFGPTAESIVTVWEIGQLTTKHYGAGTLKDASDPNALHEAKLLALDIAKARWQLDWTPRWDIEQTIAHTIRWYKRYRTEDVHKLCLEQIAEYQS